MADERRAPPSSKKFLVNFSVTFVTEALAFLHLNQKLSSRIIFRQYITSNIARLSAIYPSISRPRAILMKERDNRWMEGVIFIIGIVIRRYLRLPFAPRGLDINLICTGCQPPKPKLFLDSVKVLLDKCKLLSRLGLITGH